MPCHKGGAESRDGQRGHYPVTPYVGNRRVGHRLPYRREAQAGRQDGGHAVSCQVMPLHFRQFGEIGDRAGSVRRVPCVRVR